MKDDLTILVVDDEPGVRQSFAMMLKDSMHLLLAENGLEARAAFQKHQVDLILLDILLPDGDGLDLLNEFKSADPEVDVVMVTGVKDIRTAVGAMKRGANDYVIKPFDVEQIMAVIERSLEKRRLRREVAYLRDALKRVQPFEEMVGRSKRMEELFNLIETVSSGTGAVLIQGESGTGKELVARAIHKRSPRSAMPFVVVNCAAIPDPLVESELFGHTKGAFTGATQARTGKLEIADGGSVFLDDIDSLNVSTQAKLLRVIQEKEFSRVGSNRILHVDVRFIAASNKDLQGLIADNRFREDLYYRLNVYPIAIPPLRDRRDDIPLLLDHFMKMNARKTGAAEKPFSPGACRRLAAYAWPGNVRELQNLVERLFTITAGETIHSHNIPFGDTGADNPPEMDLKTAMSHYEKQFIQDVLDSVDGNRQEAARILGIHRNTLAAKLNSTEE
ncbi:MAG: sigma-54 dependent transcriptional regulator [Pseudomonadota bacterium]